MADVSEVDVLGGVGEEKDEEVSDLLLRMNFGVDGSNSYIFVFQLKRMHHRMSKRRNRLPRLNGIPIARTTLFLLLLVSVP